MAVTDTSGLAKGQEVAWVKYTRHSDFISAKGVERVKSVDRHGNVTLDSGKKFDRHGWERGEGYAGRAFLVTVAELAERIQAVDAQRTLDRQMTEALGRAAQVIGGHRNGLGHYGKLTAAEKAELRRLVDALPVGDEGPAADPVI